MTPSILLATSFFAATALAGEKDAETCLRTKVWDGYADGWGVRTMTTAALADGATKNYLVTLYQGNEYRIRTCGDEGVTDLDVLLYDSAGKVIARDESANREPEITFSPPSTGTYYVVLYHRQPKAPGTTGNVAMAVVYR
jgi:Bacterial pre-peptidase C-terminal domain